MIVFFYVFYFVVFVGFVWLIVIWMVCVYVGSFFLVFLWIEVVLLCLCGVVLDCGMGWGVYVMVVLVFNVICFVVFYVFLWI